MNTVINLASTFMLGLLTPLTAVCVLPLYPGFLSFLSGNLATDGGGRGRPVALGALVAGGVILFMVVVGLVFTTIIETSLTGVIRVVSPIAFGVLAIISVSLILNIDASKLLRQARIPSVKNPYVSALLYGLFFGAIVIPCNPGMIAAFFSKALATSTPDFLLDMLHFLLFGIGIGFPLLVIAVVSGSVSQTIVRFLVSHKSVINRVAGIIMLGVSVYYLFFVFRVIGG